MQTLCHLSATDLIRTLRAALLLTLLLAPPALAQLASSQIRGRAPQLVDTGLLDFAGQRVHLYGLRGLAPDETCPLDEASGSPGWPCGGKARWAARNRIAGHCVDCIERARGSCGETFAVCYLGGSEGRSSTACWSSRAGRALLPRITARPRPRPAPVSAVSGAAAEPVPFRPQEPPHVHSLRVRQRRSKPGGKVLSGGAAAARVPSP